MRIGGVARAFAVFLCLWGASAAAQDEVGADIDAGHAALAAGQTERAGALAERALAAATTEAQGYAALALAAEVALKQDDPASAADLAARADARAEALFGAVHAERLSTLDRLARAAAASGQTARAVRAYAEAARITLDLGLPAPSRVPPALALAELMREAPAAVSVLAADVMEVLRQDGRVFGEAYTRAALLRAEAELARGRPAWGLMGLLDVLDTGARRHVEAFPATEPMMRAVFSAYDARAARLGDVAAVTEGWIAQARALRAARVPLDWGAVEREVGGALGAGDLAGAEAAAQRHLDGLAPDDPRAVPVLRVLVAAHLALGEPRGAAHWLLRLAQYPPGYLASVMSAPWEAAGPVIDALADDGRHDAALALSARMIAAGALAYGDAAPGVLSMRLVRADMATLQGRPEISEGEVQAVLTALDAAPRDDPYFRAWAIYEDARLRLEAGRETEALDTLNAARLVFDAAGLADDPLIFDILRTTSEIELRLGRGDAAVALAGDYVARVGGYFGRTSRELGVARLTLVAALNAAGREEEAREVLARLRAEMSPPPVPGDPLWQTLIVSDLLQAQRTGAAADLDGALAELAAAQAGGTLPETLELTFLTVLANLTYDQGRADLAADLLARANTLVPDVDHLRLPLQVLGARLATDAGDLDAALALYREATPVALAQGGTPAHLPHYLEALQRKMNALSPEESAPLMGEAFALTQRINTTVAGTALQQAAARWEVGPDLGGLLREIQDGEADAAALREALGLAAAQGRDAGEMRLALAARLKATEAARARMAERFPAYSAHGTGAPVGLDALRALLGPEEAMLVFASTDLTTRDGAAVSQMTLVVREGAVMVGIPESTALADMAQHLRCAAALTDPRCALGTGAAGTRGGFVLDPAAGEAAGGEAAAGEAAAGRPDFDFEAAHIVYRTLIAPLKAELAGKRHLIVVPDAATIPLPFHLLLSAAPGPETTHADAPWLIRDHAISVVPSVASFRALREAAPSPARMPAFLGVGDPLIGRQATGPVAHECGEAAPVLTAAVAPDALTRGAGRADALRGLAALPDTRCELARIAESFGSAHTLMLQEGARESTLKARSAAGELLRYSVIGFATHGLIAGEIGPHDAGLVMTPPATQSDAEDGLLTTAEIAALQLDAEFVILSACNTASGRAGSEEGLSGLASAFFYAGARSLLISHWPVYSDAAVELTTGLFAELARDPGIGRAEAMRRAILARLDDPFADARQSHPVYWAPFMLVGAV